MPPTFLRTHMNRRPFPTSDELEAMEAQVQDELTKVRDPLLNTRQTTHGSFEQNALISQSIKRIMRASGGWELLTDVERESMDMIALKFSRILSGRSLELQHWEDVVGYAKLAEELCKPL